MPAALPARETIDRLTAILKRDLKLGSDVPISEQTPLLGGNHDLDSLDVVLLLTSVEREFSIKIPNDAIWRDAFATVATLAGYIEQRRA